MIRYWYPPSNGGPRGHKQLISINSGVQHNPAPSTARGMRRAKAREDGRTLPQQAKVA